MPGIDRPLILTSFKIRSCCTHHIDIFNNEEFFSLQSGARFYHREHIYRHYYLGLSQPWGKVYVLLCTLKVCAIQNSTNNTDHNYQQSNGEQVSQA